MQVVRLTRGGIPRVLNGEEGMTFVVDHFTDSLRDGAMKVAQVRDYRYPQAHKPFQIWTLAAHQYEEVAE